MEEEIEEDKIQEYVQRKSELKDSIDALNKDIETLKAYRKQVDKHINFSHLPED